MTYLLLWNIKEDNLLNVSFIHLSIYLSIYYGSRESSTRCNFRKHMQREKAPANQENIFINLTAGAANYLICLCCEHLQRVCCKIDEVVFLRSCFQVYITVSHKSYTYIYKSLENTVYYVYIVEMCILYIVYNCLLYIVQMCILCKCVYCYSCIL